MNKNIYRQSRDCLSENMGGELLLYIPSTASAVQLNDSSRIVWQLCDGERTVEDIMNVLCDIYPEQAGQISDDVRRAIEMLLDNRVLELVN